MIHRGLRGALLAAVIAVVAWAAAPGGDGAHAPVPAPPPATCRVAPQDGWGEYATDPAATDLAPFQDYRVAMGIAAGMRGGGVTIADVEYEWRPRHVEVAGLGLPAPPPTGLRPEYRAAEHGTAVLGVLAGSPDGRGVSGLVPGAAVRPVSPYAGGRYDPAAAVRTAAAGLARGDVLLVELQAIKGDMLVPIESIPEVRDAIRAAVDAGIVVVEPAGNGGIDIGAAAVPHLAGQTAPGHSGALIVGAGGSDQDAAGPSARRRTAVSNYGSRIDLQGVGAGVVTSGYGDGLGGTGDRAYTSCFDGTSSAAATVAAAAAALQGGAIAQNGAPLTPGQVRTLLVETGLPQVDPQDGPIGPLPQADQALARLAGAPPPADQTPPPSEPAAPADGVAPVPVAPGVAAGAVVAPAAARVTARYARAGGRLTIALKGLVAGARVTVRGRVARVVRGTVRLRGVRPGRIVVTVAPPARLRSSHRGLRVVVVVTAAGATRVVRL